ncbi:hypothetical protein DFH06DRAFT_1142118 [Mycena polygramma]|nr:hypothetical protein DFH06DRAFT_1142118 [Mycena polygramma]
MALWTSCVSTAPPTRWPQSSLPTTSPEGPLFWYHSRLFWIHCSAFLHDFGPGDGHNSTALPPPESVIHESLQCSGSDSKSAELLPSVPGYFLPGSLNVDDPGTIRQGSVYVGGISAASIGAIARGRKRKLCHISHTVLTTYAEPCTGVPAYATPLLLQYSDTISNTRYNDGFMIRSAGYYLPVAIRLSATARWNFTTTSSKSLRIIRESYKQIQNRSMYLPFRYIHVAFLALHLQGHLFLCPAVSLNTETSIFPVKWSQITSTPARDKTLILTQIPVHGLGALYPDAFWGDLWRQCNLGQGHSSGWPEPRSEDKRMQSHCLQVARHTSFCQQDSDLNAAELMLAMRQIRYIKSRRQIKEYLEARKFKGIDLLGLWLSATAAWNFTLTGSKYSKIIQGPY